MSLAEIRKQIDALDSELLELLSRRADLVHEVGHLKRRDGLSIYAPEREEQLLQSLIRKNKGRLPETAVRAIYREIMSASLALEKDVAIAFLGPEATWNHQAAREKFGASVRYISHASISAVLSAIVRRQADYGVVPLTFSGDGGLVEHVLDQLEGSQLKICAEILLSLIPGAPPERFLVLGHDLCPPTGADETTVTFTLEDRPGGLAEVLDVLKQRKISVNRIESRERPDSPAKALVFAALEGHAETDPLRGALAELQHSGAKLQVLGTYPKAPLATAPRPAP